MATSYILYRSEKISYQFTQAPAGPSQSPFQTTAQILAQNTHVRATFQDPDNGPCDPPAEQTLFQEIEELCMATLIIDQAFYDIGRKLSDASKQQKKRVDLYDACHTLESQWNEHHLTYKTLLWRSRELAGEAQWAVDDFREVVLPSLRGQDMTDSEKKGIMQKQLELLRDISRPSQNLCQEFLDFGRELDAYVADFSRAVGSLEIAKQSQNVSGLEDRLRNARMAMEDVNKEVKELGWKFAGDVADTGISLLLAFVVPTWWAKVANAMAFGLDCIDVKQSAPPFFEAWKRRDLAVAGYEALKAECELQRACLGQMVKLESALHESRPLVHEVTMRLGIFANVWAAITADIRKLKNSLQHGGDPTSPLFVQRVKRLEKMYGYLSQALHHYQVTDALCLLQVSGLRALTLNLDEYSM